MSKSSKGSSFEREICTLLSKWWSNGKRDDIFWRTSGSGARATTRNKKGKTTFGQCGDVQAVDPIGQPLLDVCSIELKRGYNKYSFMDLIDKPEKAKLQKYELFIKQSIKERKNAGVSFWILITKRDRRKPLVCIPEALETVLELKWNNDKDTYEDDIPFLVSRYGSSHKQIYIRTLEDFLKRYKPIYFEKIAFDR